jgi:glutathione peroxidase-family protein
MRLDLRILLYPLAIRIRTNDGVAVPMIVTVASDCGFTQYTAIYAAQHHLP